jgi:EpsI family protein
MQSMTSSIKYFAVGFALLMAAIMGKVLEPGHVLIEKASQVNLESIIPKQFGGWKEAPRLDNINVGTTVADDENKQPEIYDQTVSRNYIGPNGDVVMLTVAYGAKQNDELKVHRPEVCYAAQGFQILKDTPGNMRFGNLDIPVTRVVTRNGPRIEPVTYWIRIGNETVRGGMHLRLAVIKAGLTGNIPDGLLMRVSTITNSDSAMSSDREFAVQNDFLADFIGSTLPEQRVFQIGKGSAL